jgi:hypothetical protein
MKWITMKKTAREQSVHFFAANMTTLEATEALQCGHLM